jgi:hypothetical protein
VKPWLKTQKATTPSEGSGIAGFFARNPAVSSDLSRRTITKETIVEPSSDRPVPRKPAETANPMHVRDRHFWLVTLWAFSIGGALAIGCYIAWASGQMPLRFAAPGMVVGAIALASVSVYALEKKPAKLWRPGPMLIGVAAFTWALIGWQTWMWFHQSPTANVSNAAFINPLHQEVVKWKIAEGIRAATLAGNLSAHCHATIIRIQQSYAEDYAADLKKIMNVVGWGYDERFPGNPVDKGLTVRGVVNDIQSRACAVTLINQFKTNARTRTGTAFDAPQRWLNVSEAPDYLKGCDGGCIEVDFGNDDNQ